MLLPQRENNHMPLYEYRGEFCLHINRKRKTKSDRKIVRNVAKNFSCHKEANCSVSNDGKHNVARPTKKGKGKDKVNPITGHEGPEEE